MRVYGEMISHVRSLLIAALSCGPTIILLFTVFFEPLIYQADIDRKTVAEVADIIRLITALLILIMIYYFIRYARRSHDPALEGKKSLWIFVLLLGNVFAVPLFWFFVFRNRSS